MKKLVIIAVIAINVMSLSYLSLSQSDNSFNFKTAIADPVDEVDNEDGLYDSQKSVTRSAAITCTITSIDTDGSWGGSLTGSGGVSSTSISGTVSWQQGADQLQVGDSKTETASVTQLFDCCDDMGTGEKDCSGTRCDDIGVEDVTIMGDDVPTFSFTSGYLD